MVTGFVKADAERNKMMMISRIGVPRFGELEARISVDFTTGTSTTYVPYLGICETRSSGQGLDFKAYMNMIFDPKSGMTTYKGEESPAWDSETKYWKFSHLEAFLNMQSYWEQSSGNLKWTTIGLGNLGDYAVNFKRGYEPATFTDDDFIIQGCNPTQTNQVYA